VLRITSLLVALLAGITVAATTIEGRFDGNEVQLVRALGDEPLIVAKVRADGSFRIATEASGFALARFESAGGGEPLSAALYLRGRPVLLDVRSRAPKPILFGDSTSFDARFAGIYDAMMARRKSFHRSYSAWRESGQPLEDFTFDWIPFIREIDQQLLDTPAGPLRQLLLLSVLDLGYGPFGAVVEPDLVRRVLAEVPPRSTLWEIEPDWIGVALRDSGGVSYSAYLEEMISNHPAPALRALVRARYSPDRRIAPGRRIPSFDVASVTDAGVRFSDRTLVGRVVLLDFWATWCQPCVDELPTLKRAWQQNRTRGFEILSVSLDDDPAKVTRFQKEHFEMPWLNAIATGGLDDPSVRAFELSGLPSPILIDRKGAILATGDELRGSRLRRTLKLALQDR